MLCSKNMRMNNTGFPSYQIPILFVFFNRKEVAVKSFERIRAVRPRRLYLAQDGAREANGENEHRLILEIRESILSLIDWECEVKTLFRPQNVGCAEGVKTAVDWLFQNEEKGIVLEDDCVVQDSFFPFMEEMLTRYASDDRVGMIAGFNGIGQAFASSSYTFSRYKACWGWATWRRAWSNMDMEMSWRGTEQEQSILYNMGGNGRDIDYWKYRIKCIDAGYVSSWDWPWYFSLSAQNQLCIFPEVSLVSNIGFGSDATHTTTIGQSQVQSLANDLSFPLRHPDRVIPNVSFDKHFYRYNNSLYNAIIQMIPFGLKRWIKSILK